MYTAQKQADRGMILNRIRCRSDARLTQKRKKRKKKAHNATPQKQGNKRTGS
jgi:hypothetical protein